MMPKRIPGILFILTLLVFSAGIAHAITIETKKGDVIKGEIGMTSIRIELELGGVLSIAPGEIADISGEDMDTFKLKDGTVLRGKIGEDILTIKTSYGNIAIPVSEIKRIDFGTLEGTGEGEGEWK